MTDEPEQTDSTSTTDRGSRNESLRIGIGFLVCIVGLYLLRWWEPIDVHVIEPFTMLIANIAHVVLGWTGADVSQNGTTINYGGIQLNILEECNGVPAIIVFVSAILAYPAAISRKLLGLVIGIPAIFLVNQIRVLSLFFIYKYLSPRMFDLMHIYVWQFVIITFAVLLWIYWAERFVRGHGTQDTPA